MKCLTNILEFPDYSEASRDGIIALGGDLSVERLELAYRKGIFPWFNDYQPIIWWFPNPRFVLFPNELKVSKSMRKILRDNVFHFTENQHFEAVIRNCQLTNRPDQDGTWITEDMLEAYIELHKQGLAKSVEVWQNDEIVGGFYGVDVGNGMFCGESMFAKVSNASKAGFIYFVQKYSVKYKVIDCQAYTSHLESLGARNIDIEEFISFL